MTEQLEFFNNIRSIDKSKGTKICIKCKQEKSLESFIVQGGKRNRTNDYVRMNVCKKCERKREKQVIELKKIVHLIKMHLSSQRTMVIDKSRLDIFVYMYIFIFI